MKKKTFEPTYSKTRQLNNKNYVNARSFHEYCLFSYTRFQKPLQTTRLNPRYTYIYFHCTSSAKQDSFAASANRQLKNPDVLLKVFQRLFMCGFRFRLRLWSDLRFFSRLKTCRPMKLLVAREKKPLVPKVGVSRRRTQTFSLTGNERIPKSLKPLMTALVAFIPHGTMRTFLPGPI